MRQFSQCRTAHGTRGVQVDLTVELHKHIGNEGLTGRARQFHRTGLGTQCLRDGLNNQVCRLDLAHLRCGLLHSRGGRDEEVGHLGRLRIDGQKLIACQAGCAGQCFRYGVPSEQVFGAHIRPQIEQARQSKRRSVG